MSSEVALATTKRKFYKALDTFTTTSQVSLASATIASSEISTPVKRPATAIEAFDAARERASKRLRHSTSSTSLAQPLPAAVAVASKSGTIKVPSVRPPNGPQEPPNFAPWSHEEFLKRLKTFASVSLWHPKPEAINEVEWAKRGWRCVDVNTVGCKGGCGRRVIVSLDPARKKTAVSGESGENEDEDEDQDEFEKALTERYIHQIIEGHAPSCLWRKAGCKDDIYHLQIVRSAVWQPDLKARFASAQKILDSIKDVHLRAVERDGVKMLPPDRLLTDLPSEIVGEYISEAERQAFLPAFEVALHGWRGSTEANSALLHCDACFQRIGLWMYQPGYHSNGATTVADEDDDGEEQDNSTATIDLVNMHRDHCPWRNASVQRASGTLRGLNACEILQRVASTFARDYRRRSAEQMQRSGASGDGAEAVESGEGVAMDENDVPVLSRDEIAAQDKERESRLRKIKNMFSIRRKTKKA